MAQVYASARWHMNYTSHQIYASLNLLLLRNLADWQKGSLAYYLIWIIYTQDLYFWLDGLQPDLKTNLEVEENNKFCISWPVLKNIKMMPMMNIYWFSWEAYRRIYVPRIVTYQAYLFWFFSFESMPHSGTYMCVGTHIHTQIHPFKFQKETYGKLWNICVE